jgi:hypothetical protein
LSSFINDPFLTTGLRWLDVLWGGGPYTRKTVEREKPSSVADIDTQTGVPGTYYHNPFKGTEWHTYAIHVSIVLQIVL